MHIEPEIKAIIKKITVPYEIVKKKDHYFLFIPGHDRICIAGNHGRHRVTQITNTVRNIQRLIEKIEGGKRD